MNIRTEWREIEKGASISLKDWEELKDFIWKQQLKIEELTKSREKWKLKFIQLKGGKETHGTKNTKTRSTGL